MLFFSGEPCKTVNNADGACAMLSNCPSLVKFVNQYKDDQRTMSLMETAQNNCGSNNPLVCCKDPILNSEEPTASSSRASSSPEKSARAATLFSSSNMPCRDPHGSVGLCKNLNDCPAIKNQFASKSADFFQYLKQSNLKCRNIEGAVCCPSSTRSTDTSPHGFQGRLITSEEGCGSPNGTVRKIVGGTTARPGEFYTMELLLNLLQRLKKSFSIR